MNGIQPGAEWCTRVHSAQGQLASDVRAVERTFDVGPERYDPPVGRSAEAPTRSFVISRRVSTSPFTLAFELR
jgi:hypothetical protein